MAGKQIPESDFFELNEHDKTEISKIHNTSPTDVKPINGELSIDRDRTDPRGRTPLKKRRATIPRFADAVRTRVWDRAFDIAEDHPRTVALFAGAMITSVLIISLTLFTAVRGSGIAPEVLLGIFQNMEAGEFDKADGLLNELSDNIPPSLDEALRTRVLTARNHAAVIFRKNAQQAFEAKQYGQAVVAGTRAIHLATDSDTLFLLAKALRSQGRIAEAGKYYKRFLEEYVDDRRMDDAMFWHAESLTAEGKIEEALALFERVAGMDHSNYKKSAGKRLESLRDSAVP